MFLLTPRLSFHLSSIQAQPYRDRTLLLLSPLSIEPFRPALAPAASPVSRAVWWRTMFHSGLLLLKVPHRIHRRIRNTTTAYMPKESPRSRRRSHHSRRKRPAKLPLTRRILRAIMLLLWLSRMWEHQATPAYPVQTAHQPKPRCLPSRTARCLPSTPLGSCKLLNSNNNNNSPFAPHHSQKSRKSRARHCRHLQLLHLLSSRPHPQAVAVAAA